MRRNGQLTLALALLSLLALSLFAASTAGSQASRRAAATTTAAAPVQDGRRARSTWRRFGSFFGPKSASVLAAVGAGGQAHRAQLREAARLAEVNEDHDAWLAYQGAILTADDEWLAAQQSADDDDEDDDDRDSGLRARPDESHVADAGVEAHLAASAELVHPQTFSGSTTGDLSEASKAQPTTTEAPISAANRANGATRLTMATQASKKAEADLTSEGDQRAPQRQASAPAPSYTWQSLKADFRKGGWVFLIRHGEKLHDDRPGLSQRGIERSKCLINVFGRGARRVDYAMAPAFRPDGRRRRAFETLKPLARKLSISLDTHCERDDARCVARAVEAQTSRQRNVVVSWEHHAISDVATKLGVDGLWFPPSRFDIVAAVKRGKVHAIFSQECRGLDEEWFDWRARRSRSGRGRGGEEGLLVDDDSWADDAGH